MKGRVLVVDDEPEIRRALRTGLGYHDLDWSYWAVNGTQSVLAAFL